MTGHGHRSGDCRPIRQYVVVEVRGGDSGTWLAYLLPPDHYRVVHVTVMGDRMRLVHLGECMGLWRAALALGMLWSVHATALAQKASPPLVEAAARDSVQGVRDLIAADADLNQRDENDTTALAASRPCRCSLRPTRVISLSYDCLSSAVRMSMPQIRNAAPRSGVPPTPATSKSSDTCSSWAHARTCATSSACYRSTTRVAMDMRRSSSC